MTLTQDDKIRRTAWLKECEKKAFKGLSYCGAGVTITDVERWLLDALQAQETGTLTKLMTAVECGDLCRPCEDLISTKVLGCE